MKLTYRGQSYESTASQSGADATQQPTKLTYRGQTYYTAPRSTDAAAASEIGVMVALRYRGSVYGQMLSDLKLHRSSQTINWRYQTGH